MQPRISCPNQEVINGLVRWQGRWLQGFRQVGRWQGIVQPWQPGLGYRPEEPEQRQQVLGLQVQGHQWQEGAQVAPQLHATVPNFSWARFYFSSSSFLTSHLYESIYISF